VLDVPTLDAAISVTDRMVAAAAELAEVVPDETIVSPEHHALPLYSVCPQRAHASSGPRNEVQALLHRPTAGVR
jgi:hypothetical protein